MKKLLATLLFLFPIMAMAQLNVLQGGTGLSSVTSNSFLIGDTTFKLKATSSPFFSTFSFALATGTSATTTNLFSTTASSSNLFTALFNGAGLTTCSSASSALIWSAGLFGCHTISSGGTGLSTTSPWTIGQVAYVNSNAAVTSVATSSLVQSTGVNISNGTTAFVIGSQPTFTIDQAFTPTWTGGHIWQASSTFTGGSTINNSTTTNSTTTRASFTSASSTNVFVSSLGAVAGTFVAADPTGKLIATTTPTGSGTTIASTKTTYPFSAYPTTAGNSNVAPANNTTMYVGLEYIPAPISFNEIYYGGSATAAGKIKVAMWSSDGSSQVFATTTDWTDTSGSAKVAVATTTSTVNITSPGYYYVGILEVGSIANLGWNAWTVGGADILIDTANGFLSHKPIYSGTLTVTADTIPATIDPTAITYVSSKALKIMFQQ